MITEHHNGMVGVGPYVVVVVLFSMAGIQLSGLVPAVDCTGRHWRRLNPPRVCERPRPVRHCPNIVPEALHIIAEPEETP